MENVSVWDIRFDAHARYPRIKFTKEFRAQCPNMWKQMPWIMKAQRYRSSECITSAKRFSVWIFTTDFSAN